MIKEVFLTGKQRHRCVDVNRKIHGGIALASELEIIDFCLGGIHFTSQKRVLTKGASTINERHKIKMIGVKGKEVRSAIDGTKKRRKSSVPIYNVAMEFTNLPQAKLNIPGQIID